MCVGGAGTSWVNEGGGRNVLALASTVKVTRRLGDCVDGREHMTFLAGRVQSTEFSGAAPIPSAMLQAVDVVDRRALVGNLTHLFAQLPRLSEVANQDAVGKYSLYVREDQRTVYNLSCADTVYYQAVLNEAAEAVRLAWAWVSHFFPPVLFFLGGGLIF